MRLTDVAGTPYWIAPEVIQDSNTGYSFKSDIWSFGVTALVLAHGGPPFSYRPPSKSLMLKMKKRFGFSDYDYDEKSEKYFKNNQFSHAFKDMVASCLDQDPSRRPSADQLLQYSFFKNCEGWDLLFNEFFRGLPNVEERFQEPNALSDGTSSQITSGTDIDSAGSSVETTRISGWKFNESKFELEPEFHAESKDDVVKTVRFGGETIIDTDTNIGFSESSTGSVLLCVAYLHPDAILDQTNIILLGSNSSNSQSDEEMKVVEFQLAITA
ncbi:hypothetical protein D5086_009323 [Populus alba]|uniref:Uncharacterized protein n=1 Tax=Populus alba TaxID=43335 RepID=A0ACC4CIJ6_POPAL